MSTTEYFLSLESLPDQNIQHPTNPESTGFNRTFIRLIAIALIALCMAVVLGVRWSNFTYYWYQPFVNAYSITVGVFIISRFVLSVFYKPPKDVGIAPTVSIIITAFNEEEAIYRTVECCYSVDYPPENFEVIVVDDGSTDGTLREVSRAQERWPQLTLVSFDRNKGKREAMAAGARVSSGEILVYVDSDSFVRRDGIKKIVQGFADPTVAAVAGHTEVANVAENGLTRMQQARYYVAFRVIKAAESIFGAVTCCPGCFSAYRRSCVMEVLDRWLNQHFLGVRATFGDDRSLTNMLLRKYRVIYSGEAIATTIVPEKHRKFLKQQLRWKKSWFRESLIAATFMWKKPPLAAVAFYAQLLFPIVAPILILRMCLWLPIANNDFISPMVYFLGTVMIGLMFSAYYLFWKSDRNWIYGLYFTIYYMIFLVWQMPYAIATQRNNGWGTR
ncbi:MULTISPECIES: glycosyltransferase family 2 protein [Methylocaldum]|jgi:hyaluronan synthase|uniref:glycosyltransferase family 2 protein n=1 Tax=unclassified Methylocaldum TaxID=2622260 RepID=UPI00098BBEA3|nr:MULTISPECIES: glycosyltransferase [unclassified Methylocaldum]MBP1149693.1 hyaluronan synthase [Methylocaldum sp. RMAD-M]